MGTFYDREIEYLESTGTQWINTGVINDTVHWSLKAQVTTPDTSSNRVLISTQASGGQFFGDIKSAGNKWGAGYTTTAQATSVASTTLSIIEIDYTTTGISATVNGVSCSRTGTPATGVPYTLFGSHYPSFPSFAYGISAKLYYARCTINGVLVRDFIPVRVGQTGYLFDRVTCQLFGNAGTGNFVLGDDMYDSRIEYVGIRQGNYIRVDYVPKGSDIIIDTNIRFQSYPNTNAYSMWFYTFVSNNHAMYRVLKGANNNQLYINNNTADSNKTTISYTPVSGTLYNFRLKFGQAAINYTTYTLNTTAGTENTSRFTIGDATTTRGVNEDIYYFKVYKASVLVVDLIPVRKGQIAYLYDRCTNQIFGKEGDVDLVLGNDIPDIPSDYDAEVEYITFDGTQSIDTGLYGDLNTDVKVTCKVTADKGFNIFGSRKSNGSNEILIMRNNSRLFAVDFFNTTSRIEPNDPQKNWVIIQTNKNLRQADAINKTLHVTNTTQFSTEFTTPNTMRIGGFEGLLSMSYGNFIGYMGAVQIRQNGTLVRDYIPVRKNGVGYLYDKITQKMFGNEFSSSFGIGHDVVWPSPVPATVGTCRYYSRREAMIEEARPYDAEVEYIASNAESGFEIVTNNAIPARSTFELKYWITNLLDIYKYQVFFSRYTNVSRTPTTRMGPRSQSYYYQGYDNSGNARYLLRSSARVGNLHTLKVDYTNKKITVDETEYNFDFTSFNASSDSSRICLFKGINSDYVGLVGRIYSFKATYNGQVVLDLIPVRKGTEGRMYDKVTGAVYKNTSTGTFVVGPDVV